MDREPEYTKEEMLAFVDVTRQMLEGKVGFSHLTGKYEALRDYLESLAKENEQLHAFLVEQGLEEEFEALWDDTDHTGS